MIKLREEGMSKAEIGLLYQTVSQVVNTEKRLLKEIKSAPPVNTWMILKHLSSLFVDMENILVI